MTAGSRGDARTQVSRVLRSPAHPPAIVFPALQVLLAPRARGIGLPHRLRRSGEPCPSSQHSSQVRCREHRQIGTDLRAHPAGLSLVADEWIHGSPSCAAPHPLGRPRSSPSPDHARIRLSVCGVATAGRSFEPSLVRDFDVATGVANELAPSQRGCRSRYASSANAEHVREKLLRHVKLARMRSVPGHQ